MLNIKRLRGVELTRVIEVFFLGFNALYEKHKPTCSGGCAICEMYRELEEGLDKLAVERDQRRDMIKQIKKEEDIAEKKKSMFWFFLLSAGFLFVMTILGRSFLLTWDSYPWWKSAIFITVYSVMFSIIFLEIRDKLYATRGLK